MIIPYYRVQLSTSAGHPANPARLDLCSCCVFLCPDLCSCLQVCLQLGTAFDPPGLLTSDLRTTYADADLLKKVTLPVMAIVGDHDRMCPASVSCFISDHVQGLCCEQTHAEW